MKRIQFIMPTPERCIELGIKYEGLFDRTRLWLSGVAFERSGFHLLSVKRNAFLVDAKGGYLLKNTIEHLKSYGFTWEYLNEVPTSDIN